MPHLTLEYSRNLVASESISRLCRKLADVLITQLEDGMAVFPTGGGRVRAIRCDEYAIADGQPEGASFTATSKSALGGPKL